MENQDLELLKKQILGEIKRDMNGAVVGVMNDLNKGETFFSFGVSIPKIKNTARVYAPNHNLAKILFETKIRELKLAAIYLDDEKQLSAEQMILWSESFESLEIAENCASMLFYKHKDILCVAQKWIDSTEKFTAKAGFVALSRRVKSLFDETELPIYNSVYKKATEILQNTDNPHTRGAAEMFVVALSNISETTKKETLKHIENKEFGGSCEEILWQIN